MTSKIVKFRNPDAEAASVRLANLARVEEDFEVGRRARRLRSIRSYLAVRAARRDRIEPEQLCLDL